MIGRRLTRRAFLAGTAAGAGAMVLAACGATPAPIATTAPTKAPAQAEATATSAVVEPTATTAPAATSGEKKVLRFATYTFSAFEDAMKQMFSDWEAQNPGATVQGEFSSWDVSGLSSRPWLPRAARRTSASPLASTRSPMPRRASSCRWTIS